MASTVSSVASNFNMASQAASIILTTVYSAIGVLGFLGNVLVIFVILHEEKMRRSATNLLILNMAIADVNIIVLGLPEIAQFVSGNGWVLGGGACKILRYHMVVCLYASVLSLTAVCIERYCPMYKHQGSLYCMFKSSGYSLYCINYQGAFHYIIHQCILSIV